MRDFIKLYNVDKNCDFKFLNLLVDYKLPQGIVVDVEEMPVPLIQSIYKTGLKKLIISVKKITFERLKLSIQQIAYISSFLFEILLI